MLGNHIERMLFGLPGFVLPPIAGMPVTSKRYRQWMLSREEGINLYRAAFATSGNVVLRKKRLMRTPEEAARYSEIRARVGQYNSDRFKLVQEGYDSVVQSAWSSQLEPMKVFRALAIPDVQSNRLDIGGKRGLCYLARCCPECHQIAVGDTNLKHSCAASGLEWHVAPVLWLPFPADIIRHFPHVQSEVNRAVVSGELLEFSSESELSNSDYQRAGYSTRPTLPPIYVSAKGSTVARKRFQRLQAIDHLYAHSLPSNSYDSRFPHLMDSGTKELYQALAGNGKVLYQIDCKQEDCNNRLTIIARHPVNPGVYKHSSSATEKTRQHQTLVGAKVPDFRCVPYSIARRAICATFFEKETMHKYVGGKLEEVLSYMAG